MHELTKEKGRIKKKKAETSCSWTESSWTSCCTSFEKNSH